MVQEARKSVWIMKIRRYEGCIILAQEIIPQGIAYAAGNIRLTYEKETLNGPRRDVLSAMS